MGRDGFEERFLFESEEKAREVAEEFRSRWADRKLKLGRLVHSIQEGGGEPGDSLWLDSVAVEERWVTVVIYAHDAVVCPEAFEEESDEPDVHLVLREIRARMSRLGAFDPEDAQRDVEMAQREARRQRLAEQSEGQRAWILKRAGVFTAKLWLDGEGAEQEEIHEVFSVEGNDRMFEGHVDGDTLHLNQRPGQKPVWDEGAIVLLHERRQAPGFFKRLFGRL